MASGSDRSLSRLVLQLVQLLHFLGKKRSAALNSREKSFFRETTAFKWRNDWLLCIRREVLKFGFLIDSKPCTQKISIHVSLIVKLDPSAMLHKLYVFSV